MESSRPDFLNILRIFHKHVVDYIIVGGVCAVLHGAPISTFDIDIVHSREPGNVDRIMKALDELKARYRDPAGRMIKPTKAHLSSHGHQLLMTKDGPLDLLGELAKGRGYDELLENTVSLVLSEGLTVRPLNLETLIQTKEEAARDKDIAILAILRRTLEEQRKK